MNYIPAVIRDQQVQQADPSDTLDPTHLPISADPGNTAEVRPDGLFVGTDLPSPVYYVSADGTDDPTSGTKTDPFQTIDYAVSHLLQLAGNVRGYQVTLALRAGDNFTVSLRHRLTGNFMFTFYGDPEFGDFDDPLTTVRGEYCADLIRPVVEPLPIVATGQPIRLAGFDTDYRLEFRGLRIDLPANPNGASNSDFGPYDVVAGTNPQLTIMGCIVNKTSEQNFAGLLGIGARSSSRLVQYASQFLITNQRAVDSSSPGLTSRQHFIHFYRDSLVNGTPFLFSTTINSNNGFGVLTLNWTDVQSQSVEGYDILSTFPVSSNVSYGLRNYFLNLQRDQQSRPLNLIYASLI